MLSINSKIHIVGGTGAMGTWLKTFLESLNYSVTISDEKNKSSSAISEAEVIFISVPISIAPKIITETAKNSLKDALIIDLSSIKSETKMSLQDCHRQSLSLHFLFGPTVHSIENQKIIFEKFGDSSKITDVLELFGNQGAQLINLESGNHDFLMAHIQSLTHFINLSLAEILIKNKVGISGQVSTPVFLSQISSTLRVLSQNPKLLTEIQTLNPKFINVVEEFIQIQNALILKIKTNKFSEIEKQFVRLRKNLESVTGETSPKSESSVNKLDNIGGLKIGYLGPEGTFSHQAVLSSFNQSINSLIPSKSIYDLFQSLQKGDVDLIIAPSENTIEGTVRETLDLLFDHEFKVIGKVDLPVSQCLLSKESSIKSIKKIISHPQAINQSRKFIELNLPEAIIETSPSTIASLEELNNKGVAVIGSELAAKIYKLNILEKNIQNFKNNITRFNIIAKSDILKLSGRTKTLLFLSVFNRVGVLRDILAVFADLSINLNKIESRPSGEKQWDYFFYIEVEITDEDPKLQQALNILKKYCPNIIVLGKL